MKTKTLLLEQQDAILRVSINRPERLNALDETVLEEIALCFGSLQRRFDVKAVILCGVGRAFSAGADREAPPGRERLHRGDVGSREKRYWSQIGRRATRAIEDCEIPTIAEVRGYAIGGGSCLALSCDFRVVAEDAIFHIPEVDLGVPLTWGATARLIFEIGAARARELILLSDRIDGRRAVDWGVAHRAVPEAELEATVQALAERLAAKPPLSVHMTKTQFRAYEERSRLGVIAETDGDLMAASALEPEFRDAFSGKPSA